MIDIHTHNDYHDDTVYVKNIQLTDVVLSDFIKEELADADLNPNKYLSIGVHPWDILKINEKNSFTAQDIIQKLMPEIITHPKVYAVGECGIDKCIDTDIETQKNLFIKQINLSEEYKKPMIIHAVRAYNEIIELRKQLKPTQTWIIHGYIGNTIIAEKLISLGCKISININKLRNPKTQQLIEIIAKEHIQYETDTEKYKI